MRIAASDYTAGGDNLAVECVSEADDPLDDGQVLRVFQHVAHETLVDLQGVGGQTL